MELVGWNRIGVPATVRHVWDFYPEERLELLRTVERHAAARERYEGQIWRAKLIKNGHTKLNPTPGCVIICTKYEGMAGNGNGKTRDQSGIWDGTVSLTFGSCPYFSELGSGHASVFYQMSIAKHMATQAKSLWWQAVTQSQLSG